MNNIIYVGYMTSFFGLKGEVKIACESNHKDKIFKVGNYLIIDNCSYEIQTYRTHSNYELVSFKDLDSIEKVEHLLKKNVYVNKDNLNFSKDEYLYIELIDLNIIENEKNIGIVKELLYNKKNIFIKSDDLIIPIIDNFIEKVDVGNKKIIVKNTKELL